MPERVPIGPGDYCRILSGPHAGRPVIVLDRLAAGYRVAKPGRAETLDFREGEIARAPIIFRDAIPAIDRW